MLILHRPLRRLRSHPDAGFTLVEMVIALVLVAIAAIAAAGVFIAAAAAQKTERSHSQAVRIATATLDDLRAVEMCSLTMGTSAATDGPHQGVTFTSTTTLEAVKASDETPLTLCSSTESVVRATTVVSWSDRGIPAEVVMSTILADGRDQVVAGNTGPSPTPSPSPSPTTTGPTLATPVFSISPLTINRTTLPVGYPAVDEDVTVAGTGFAPTTLLTGSYTDDEGDKTFSLTSTDGAIWRGTISKTALRKVVTSQTSLTVTISAPTGETSVGQLQLAPEATYLDPLTIVSASVNGSAEILLKEIKGGSHNGGENRDDIVIMANVTGLDHADGANAVTVSYALRTGGSGEVKLALQPNLTWMGTIEAGMQKIAPGSSSKPTDFTFTVHRAADEAQKVTTVSKIVRVG